MTYKHELSFRLVRIRAPLWLIASVAVILSCELPTARHDDPNPQIVQIIVAPESLSLDAEAQVQFAAYGRGANGDSASVSVSWSATGGSITSGGMFAADTAAGDFLVSATNATLNLSGSSQVRIRPRAVASVGVAPASSSVQVGQTVQLTATPRDARGRTLSGRVVTWASNNSGIATISASGLVTAVAAGSATITATSEGKSGTAAVTVTPAPVASVTLSPTLASVPVGQTVQLTATPRDANGTALTGRVVAWASSNTGVASVNGSGLVTAVAAGPAIITATSESKNGTAGITVTATAVPVASVSVSPASANLTAGQTVQLTATPRDASGNALSGRVVTWASNNSGVATVSASGLVTGVAAGSATITATSEGKSGTATLTVTAPPVATVDTIFREDFESGNLSLWDDSCCGPTHTVVTDATFAYSGSRYLQITYPQGGSGGSLSRFFMPGYTNAYVRYRFRVPGNFRGGTKLIMFRGSRTDNVWSSFGVGGLCPDGTNFFLANVVVRDLTSVPLRFYTYYVGMAKEPDGVTCYGRYGDSYDPDGGSSNPASYFPPLDVTRDQWHTLEFEVQLNDPAQANGVQRFWLDGVLRGEWRNFRFRTSTDLLLNVLTLESSMNETLGGAPQSQMIYVDDVLVTTRLP